MSKHLIGTAAVIALLAAASPLQAQQRPTGEMMQSGVAGMTAGDFADLSNARIDLVKAALGLTADQEKYWPAIETAIRSNSKSREERMRRTADRLEELKSDGIVAALQKRNPIEFLNRRADALSERAANLKRLAAAWQPLYQTLSPEQKRRLALVTIIGLREMRDNLIDQRIQVMDEDEDE